MELELELAGAGAELGNEIGTTKVYKPNGIVLIFWVEPACQIMAEKNQTKNQTNQTVQNHLEYLIFVSWDCMPNFSFLGLYFHGGRKEEKDNQF